MTGGQDTPFSHKVALSTKEIKEGKKQPRACVVISKGVDGLWHLYITRGGDKIIYNPEISFFRKPKLLVGRAERG